MQAGSHTRVAGVPAAVRVGDRSVTTASWPPEPRDEGRVARHGGWEVGRPRRCAHTCGVDRAAVQAVHAGRGDFFIDHLSRHAPTVCAYRSDRTSACASYASGGMAFLGRGQATKPKPGRVRRRPDGG